MASLSKLQQLIERVRTSKHSRFYAHRFSKSPRTWEEWEAIPLLTKAEISAILYADRILIDPRNVEMIRLTSGTTSSGVLAIPRIRMRCGEHERALMPVSSCMGFLMPHGLYDNFIQLGLRFVGGDPARLTESAILAAKMKIEGIAGLPSTLIAFADVLAQNYDMHSIRHLCLNGEASTKLQRAALERAYPKLERIVSCYASSEIQGLCAVSVSPPLRDHPNALLGHPLMHYEIVDEYGNTMRDTPARGELVISTLFEGAAFPLVRYKTGDRALMIEQGARTIFSIEGRTEGARVRFEGGVIVLEELERVLGELGNGFIADFEAKVVEEDVHGRLSIRLLITLILPAQHAHRLSEHWMRQIEKRLLISERRTYAEALERSLCLPIRCEMRSLDYKLGKKRHRLIDAREH